MKTRRSSKPSTPGRPSNKRPTKSKPSKNGDFWKPKSIAEIAAEQGITGPPDFSRLGAHDLWRTEEEFGSFLKWLKESRNRDR